MMGSNFTDEIECGSFFDNCDDLIEFPPENECCIGCGDCKDFPPIWSDHSNDFLGSDPFLSGSNSNSNSASDLSAELSVPYEDMVQLEWLSTFMDDSLCSGEMTLGKENSSVNKESSHNKFQTSSPVSVLESSSSSSSSSSGSRFRGKTLPLNPTHRGPQRARSKRPRPAAFNRRSAIQLVSPTSSLTDTDQPFAAPVASFESNNFADSHPTKKISKPAAAEHKKRKKIKLSVSPGFMDTNQNPSSQSVRKCLHCEVTKTPQWRAGPMGPKTLCNACGVRYKSGRLFPEYRPAASPTFLPSVHSNSHKKVLEMRSKASDKTCMVGTPATTPPTTETELLPSGDFSQENL